jgi:GNAT superfamily N-acetyltransferase
VAWTIARPTPDDLDEMGRVHVQVWREAYAGLMPDDYLAGLDPTFGPTRWRERFGETADLGWWIARDDDGIVGMITAGPPRDEDAPVPFELYAINVLRRAHGTGLADVRMPRAVAARPAYHGVLEGNDRANAFSRRHGFSDEGGRKPEPETDVVEIRMARGHAGA